MSHSLGPWRRQGHIVYGIELGKPIAKVFDQPIEAEIEANISLISAAPVMLKELEFLVSHCTEKRTREYSDGSEYEIDVIIDYGDIVGRIRNLIARARGEE